MRFTGIRGSEGDMSKVGCLFLRGAIRGLLKSVRESVKMCRGHHKWTKFEAILTEVINAD